MPQLTTTYTLLLSCPNDVRDRCFPVIDAVVEEFNKYAIPNLNIHVNLRDWKTGGYPQSGDRPQELVHKQLVDTADAAIAIFWTRFGTPTGKYDSGTEEEIDRLIKDGKQVFLYFLDTAIPPSATDSSIYRNERKKIASLRKKYNGLYWDVADEVALKTEVSSHLSAYFTKRIADDSGLVRMSEKSKLTVSAIDGSQLVVAQKLNLLDENAPQLQSQKDAIVKKIKEVQNIKIPRSVQKTRLQDVNADAVTNKLDLKIRQSVSETLEYTQLVSSLLGIGKSVVISDARKAVVSRFCSENNLELPECFWDLGNLREQKNPISFFGEHCSLAGSEEEKQKHQLLLDIIVGICAYTVSRDYYRALDGLTFIELVVRNEGKAFDEDIEVKLSMPNGNLVQDKDFPVPIYEIEEINENDLAKKWFCPMPTEDIDEFDYSSDYSSSGSIAQAKLDFRKIDFPPMRRNYEEEYQLAKEIYMGKLNQLFEWEVFTSYDMDIIKIRIKKLNPFSAMHFPARLFLKAVPEKIEYQIKATQTPSIIKGTINLQAKEGASL